MTERESYEEIAIRYGLLIGYAKQLFTQAGIPIHPEWTDLDIVNNLRRRKGLEPLPPRDEASREYGGLQQLHDELITTATDSGIELDISKDVPQDSARLLSAALYAIRRLLA